VSSPALQIAVPARPSRRDDQTRETKLRLLGAAVALITEVGWRKTTVEHIVERAGVAKGTFFVHFKTKEAIVISLVHAQINAASAARDAAMAGGGSPVDRLRAATMMLGMQAASNLELSRAVLIAGMENREIGDATDSVFNQLYTRMIEDAREALAMGLLEGPDAETVAGLVMACYLGATLHSVSSPRAKPLAVMLEPLVDATLDALRPKHAKTKTKITTKTSKRRGAGR
jgi:AcrR family transcriptional regulator